MNSAPSLCSQQELFEALEDFDRRRGFRGTMQGGGGGDGGGRKAEAESSSALAGSKPERGPDELSIAAAADSEAAASAAAVEVEVGGSEEDDEDGEEVAGDAGGFVPSPLIPLKEQLEKDKEDESLRRWKEQLLGCVGELNGQVEPEVVFHSIGVVSEGCAETVTALPFAENDNHVLFTLKEGSHYQLKLTFSVKHNIVSGLTYSNMVWKRGLKVDHTRGMLGTFAPQREPYEHLLEEETTPSGVLARGTYSAKLKFEDDDKRCHLELSYTFEIKKR